MVACLTLRRDTWPDATERRSYDAECGRDSRNAYIAWPALGLRHFE